MTDGQFTALLIAAAVIGWLFRKKKKNQSTEFFFVDVVEVWEAPKKRPSSALINIVVVAGIIFLIWAMNH
jgi:hypothetical protein